ncbi:MAG: ankyrin repeat domain-containing protein [Albidovulum sp.]|nr:ankyrin repeat domain-containing protein [Albidovulum sp.]
MWVNLASANEPAPIPVDIPNHALKNSEAFAEAIEIGLPVSLAGKAKGLLHNVKSMSVLGPGLSIDWSFTAPPESLRFRRNRAVVLMIDEAQNLDLSSPRAPAAELLLWLHQGNHGLPLVPVLAGLSNLESRLAAAGISRLSVDAVYSLGCLTRDETRQSAELFFEYFGIPRSELRNAWAETLYDLSEGWPAHLHHGFRSLSAVLADAGLRLEAVDVKAFRREEARLWMEYYDARTDMLPVQLIARMLDKVGASGTRDDYIDAIAAEHDARPGGFAFRIPAGLDAAGLFESILGKGLLQRGKYKRYRTPVRSLEGYIVALSGSPLHLAALSGDESSVASALAEGEDPNFRDIRGRTPLHVAAECGWTGIAKTLHEAGADPEVADQKGRRPGEILPRHATEETKRILEPEIAPNSSNYQQEPAQEQ